MSDRVQIGNTPFYYEPKQGKRVIVSVVALVILGFGVGWGYALAFIAGSLVWSITLR